jgi:acetyl-CoA carboxylase carboxyltransferase component
VPVVYVSGARRRSGDEAGGLLVAAGGFALAAGARTAALRGRTSATATVGRASVAPGVPIVVAVTAPCAGGRAGAAAAGAVVIAARAVIAVERTRTLVTSFIAAGTVIPVE